MENTITYKMLEHHKKINKDLMNLMDGFGMSNDQLDHLFENFKNDLLFHIQIEEQVVFSFSDLGSTEAQNIIRDLLLEHGQIRDFLMNFDFPKDYREQLLDFQKVLFEHERKENEVLYPMLDKNLSEEDKVKMVKNIKELA